MSSHPPLRIGILGCANIARKNAIAIRHTESNCVVTAVASRSADKAQAFVQEMFNKEEHEVVAWFGSYDELIASTLVDALYIPLPTALHKEWVLKALQAGKHVLLEKPVALNVQDYQEMIQAAQRHKKYLMDGTMFVHHPRTAKFVEAVHNADTFGRITRIEAGFSFFAGQSFFETNIRASSTGDPLGCLGDLGWYVVRMALLVAGPNAVPTSAQVVDFQQTQAGVPIDATCLVKFNNPELVLNFQVSFNSQFRQYVHVIGTKAWASMDDFVLPKQHPVEFSVQSMGLTQYDLITEHSKQPATFDGPVQEVLMWNTFARLAARVDAVGGSWEAEQLSRISKTNQQILDALMKSMQEGGAKVESFT